MTAPLPENEIERLIALHTYQILDTPPEAEFDDLIHLAAQICGLPIAAISLIDAHRQWFKASQGLDVPETSRDMAFCAYTILQSDIMIVHDAQSDPRFADNPMVLGSPQIRFYAGAPLITSGGYILGSLCVIDKIPRNLTHEQIEGLQMIARQIIGRIELSKQLSDQKKKITELETIEEAQRGLKEFVQAALDGLTEEIAILDGDGTILAVNQSWRQFAVDNTSVDQPMTERPNYLEVCDEATGPEAEEAHQVAAGIRAVVAGERDHFTLEYPCHSEQEQRWFSLRVTPFPGEGKARVVISHENVTARKQAEIVLKESQQRLALATKSAQIGIWDWDIPANKILWDAQMFTLYGIEEKDFTVVYDTWQKGLHPEDRERAESELATALNGTSDFHTQFRVIWPNNEVHYIEAHAVVQRSDDGVPVRMIGVNWDVTEREQAEAALTQAYAALGESEERFRGSVNAMEEGLALQDKDGSILFCNESAERILGLNADQMMGRTSLDPRWRAVRHTGEDFPGEQHPAMVALSTGIAQRNIVMGIHKPTGELTWVSINAVPLVHEAQDTPHGVVVTFSDITERRIAEETLRNSTLTLEIQKQELERANAELEALATTDGLTGLKNHRAFQERLASEVSRASRYETPISLIMLDVDHFKQYNDTYGHPAGDAVLKTIAASLQHCARETDIVSRYGGEEFVIILLQTDAECALSFAERVQAYLASREWPLQIVTVSMGVASLGPQESGADLITHADTALYQSKAAGRNCVTNAPSSGI